MLFNWKSDIEDGLSILLAKKVKKGYFTLYYTYHSLND